ncbi:hypothetical protein ACFQ1I_12730 [Kitasatospora arboriphila]
MLKPNPDPDPAPRESREPLPEPDEVPRYRRCGRCARCHGGGPGAPPTGDCWSDYLDAVTAVLTRAACG